MSKYTLEQVQPQPIYIESSGRWQWPLPERACFPGCCTSVVTASREWWEYAPSEAKPHPISEAIQLRDGVWYWTIPAALLRERESAKARVTHTMIREAKDAFENSSARDATGWWRSALEAVAPMLASARVPDELKSAPASPLHPLWGDGYLRGWNACRDAMLAAAPKPEKE